MTEEADTSQSDKIKTVVNTSGTISYIDDSDYTSSVTFIVARPLAEMSIDNLTQVQHQLVDRIKEANEILAGEIAEADRLQTLANRAREKSSTQHSKVHKIQRQVHLYRHVLHESTEQNVL